jgi:glutathione peroxidase
MNFYDFSAKKIDGQEPGSNKDVKQFCEINYGVTFQLFEKTDIRGFSAHPLFKHLSEAAPFKGFDLNK